MSNDLLLHQIAFAALPGMTLDLGRQLLEVVGDESRFFAMSEKELVETIGTTNRMFERHTRNNVLHRAESELEFISDKKIEPVYYTSPRYPRRLNEINDAPMMLYVTGDCDLNSRHAVSVVGTRNATPAGVQFCDTFVGELASMLPDVLIVSGLAYGIDIAAHRAAMRHDAHTVAVMARGLNRIYPAVHRRDAVNIVKHGGALVTDYMSQDELHKGNFLARNRIIAAMADVTVVVESASHGGSLVTASLAMGYNRDVMAVPGRLGDEMSRGCNKLIAANRAALLTSARQLVEAMRWDADMASPPPAARQLSLFDELDDNERAIVEVLRSADAPLHGNDIAAAVHQPTYIVTSTLVELDFKGVITTLPGSRYQLL